MNFNQDNAMSLLNRKPLKLVNKFLYLNTNITSTESNVNLYTRHGEPMIKNNMEVWYLIKYNWNSYKL